MPLEVAGYRVGDVLGEGGSGTVYAATRDADERAVAIKVLRADLALTEGEVKRFLAEAALLARVAHPGIVAVLDAGQLADGRPYLVMPRLAGESLAHRLARGPVPPEMALAMFEQLADAVETLHAAGVIHRDLKPDNVFVDGERVVLLDFGIAKDTESSPSTTTTEGRVRGTPAYMAPERFFHAAASTRSDVYELAVVVYEMLVGALPWADLEDVGARLDPDGRDLPPAIWRVLRAALASNAAQRPASVRAFRDELRAAAAVPDEAVALRTRTIKRALIPTTDRDAVAVIGSSVLAHDTAPGVTHVAANTAPDAAKRPLRMGLAIAAALLVSGGAIAFAVIARDDEPAPARTEPDAVATVAFCARHSPTPLFCADFEGAGDIRTGFWNAGKSPDSGESGGGTIRALDVGPSSPSRALKLSTPALATPQTKASAFVVAELADVVRYATIYLRVRIETEGFTDDTSVAQLFSLSWGEPGAITLSRRKSGMQLLVFAGKNPPEKVPLSAPVPVGTWVTFRIVIRNYASPTDPRGEVSVFADGAVARAPLPVALQGAGTPPRLSVGIVASRGPSAPLEVGIDDLSVTTFEGD